MLHALQHVAVGFLRRTWLIAAVAVVICASFAARAVAALSDAALTPGAPAAPGPSAAAPGPIRPAAPAARPLPGAGEAFVARNVFCSSCAPSPGGGGGGGGAYQGHPAVLIATSLGVEPRATIRVIPTEVQGSWGLGEEIPGVGRLDLIDPTAIEVTDAAGHGKRIPLLDATAAGLGPGAATPGGRPAAGDEPNPFQERVSKIDDTTYAVDRSLVRELVMGTTKPGGVRVFPVVDAGGDVKGVRLAGVRKPSAADEIGLRSGDLISTIDGEPLKNAQQLIDLFAKLDQISAVELGGTRTGGKPLRLTLRLR